MPLNSDNESVDEEVSEEEVATSDGDEDGGVESEAESGATDGTASDEDGIGSGEANDASGDDEDDGVESDAESDATDGAASDEDSNENGRIENDEANEASDDEESDDETDEDDDSVNEQEQKKTKEELMKEKIQMKYMERHGKQLYIRFPKRLPDDVDEFMTLAKSLSPLIINAHKPRQKYARFCLVDFETQSDRDETLAKLKKATKKDPAAGLFVSKPRTEKETFLENLIEKRLQSLEHKRAKTRMRNANKAAIRNKAFTSSVVIPNLPYATTEVNVRELFPNAVDVQIKKRKDKQRRFAVATITLSSVTEARMAVKKKLSFGGIPLKIRFNIEDRRKKQMNTKFTTLQDIDVDDNSQSPKKRKSNSVELEAAPLKKSKKLLSAAKDLSVMQLKSKPQNDTSIASKGNKALNKNARNETKVKNFKQKTISKQFNAKRVSEKLES